MAEPARVFITGALGLLGRALGDHFRERGSELRGVDVRPDRGRGCVAGDVSRAGDWQEAAEGAELVIHTAAILSMRDDPDPIWRVNVLGTRNVLDAARTAGARRFLHISSVTAFSFDFPDGVTEDYPVRCNGVPYVDTKVASEQVVLQAHAAGETPCTLVRPGDVYGPGARTWTVLPVEEMRSGGFLLPAMGRGVFSPVFLDDVVDGLARAATTTEAAGQVFTISGGAGVTTAEFFGHYARLLGKRMPMAPAPVARALAAGAAGAARLVGKETRSMPPSRPISPAGGPTRSRRREVCWPTSRAWTCPMACDAQASGCAARGSCRTPARRRRQPADARRRSRARRR